MQPTVVLLRGLSLSPMLKRICEIIFPLLLLTSCSTSNLNVVRNTSQSSISSARMMSLVRTLLIRTNFYVVEAQGTDGQISDPSNEVFSTNKSVILNWFPPESGTVTNYILLVGTNSGSYLISMNVGLNLTTIFPPPCKSNVVITVTGDGLEYASNLLGPWNSTGVNNLVMTNPPGPMLFFRGTNASISAVWF